MMYDTLKLIPGSVRNFGAFYDCSLHFSFSQILSVHICVPKQLFLGVWGPTGIAGEYTREKAYGEQSYKVLQAALAG